MTAHEKQRMAITFGELVYNGQWFTPLREALSAFVDKTQERVNGTVKLKLYKGTAYPVASRSEYALYNEEFATFSADEVYNQQDATGFIRLNALRLRTLANSKQKRY